jgi:SnoaL-like domain
VGEDVVPEETIPDAVELTRQAVASGNSRDYEAMMAFYGEDSSMDMTGVGLGIYEGRSAIWQFVEDWIGSTDDISFEIEDAKGIANGVVLATIRQRGRSAGTRTTLRLDYAVVYSWEGDVCRSASHFRDIEEARSSAERLAAKGGVPGLAQ